jgi:hypothetical protein
MDLVANDLVQREDLGAQSWVIETKDSQVSFFPPIILPTLCTFYSLLYSPQLKPHCTTAQQRAITNSRRNAQNAKDVWLRDEYPLGNVPYERRLLESLLIQT